MLKFIILVALIVSEICSESFTIGYLTGSQRKPGDLEYTRPGLTISGAISLAVDEVNKHIFGPRGHKLNFLVAETYGDEVISVQETAELWKKNVSVYVGPQETCEHEAFMAAAFNLPMISYFCTLFATSDKIKFPTFARTRPPDTQISKSVASVLVAFNWTHVVLFYLKSPNLEYENVATIILQTLASAGITVITTKFWDIPYHHGYGENPFYNLVEQTYRDARIFLILGHHYEHLGLVVAMEEMGLFDKGEYFVLGVDIEQYDNENPTKYLKGLLRDEKDPVAQKAFRNYLGVVPSSPIGFENFTNLVNSYMEKPPFNFPNPLILVGGTKQIRAEAAYLYDAVYLYTKAVIEILEEGGNARNGTEVIDRIKGTHYKSAMGYIVYMDENGDAEGNYTLIARKSYNSEFGLFPVGRFALRRLNLKLPVLHLTDFIDWATGQPPIAVPSCGFRGEKCITHTMEITGGVIGGIALILLIVFLVLYRNWKYEQELDSLLWKVDYKNILINIEPGTRVSRANHPLIRTSQVSLSSNPDADFRYSTIFTQIGIYRGRVVAIKKIHKKNIDITREMKKELKTMRDLRHDNLNAFIGACTDSPNICIISEYCTRGSLRDIVGNEDVKLDNMFIASLVDDILRGMIYLHDSPLKFHGNLHSANCLIDSRWVVKLTDFGLREFKRGAEDPDKQDRSKIEAKYYNLLYKAPELLRMQRYVQLNFELSGSQKGDVYSFGIVLYELYNRQGPFGQISLSNIEILNKVARNTDSEIFRPSLEPLESSFDFVRDCLKECWAENPEERPDFKNVRAKLRPLRKGLCPNIVDNIMAMMEKYANNLEALVDERTNQLQEEKKKTEALLYEMLPRPVADQLKRGNKVEAESFDCVTIYFSDIVGFTSMSAESTPLQVVDFLNDLYTCFDSIIEHYNVYKVETIGDAYMVVSGLPLRNNNEHAAEIASMSLHLLAEVKQFSIKHRPDDKLLLRIGIHSGPVCAGVVGLKMPRYCLFGDTVNTASRIESTGAPLKIHCSKECKELLTALGGYKLEERGFVSLKGKGEQQTYWLLSEEPHYRNIRRRDAKNESLTNNQLDKNDLLIDTRSSLKIKSGISRCSSFESSKKLRFANDENQVKKNLNVEFILDQNQSIKMSVDCSCDACKTSSTSCPCMDSLLGTIGGKRKEITGKLRKERSGTAKLQMSQLMEPCMTMQSVSAPTSPAPPSIVYFNKFQKKWGEIPLCLNDSTPLLKITKPPDSETCI